VALEAELAGLFRAGGTLPLNSGYAANTALLSAIPQKGDTILYDEYSHASLKEGARLSFANRFRLPPQRPRRPRTAPATGLRAKAFVVAESVYSMDGDFAPLRELLDVCERYGANLIWDEAHSTGLWGTAGNGIACGEGLQDRIFARIYTFGKALGVHGACVAGSRVLVDYLVNFARPFIYTTALPLHSLVSVREAFRFLAARPELPAALHAKIARFRQAAGRHDLPGHLIPGRSPIQALRVGGNEPTKKAGRPPPGGRLRRAAHPLADRAGRGGAAADLPAYLQHRRRNYRAGRAARSGPATATRSLHYPHLHLTFFGSYGEKILHNGNRDG
jgi:8-amino-7-oxononanoate synthase